VVVGWRNSVLYLSAGLNHRRDDGRVPSKRESLEQELDIRVLSPRRDGGAGALDVHQSNRLTQHFNLEMI
jgi:hypothetical protein